MTEAVLVAKIKKHIEARWPGCVVIKLSDRFTRGLPDLMVIGTVRSGTEITTEILFLEVKLPGGKLTKLQRHWLEQLRATGAEAGVFKSIEQVENVLQFLGV